MGQVEQLAESPRGSSREWARPSCIPVAIIIIVVLLVVSFPLIDHGAFSRNSAARNETAEGIIHPCSDSCVVTLVESIPENLTFDQPVHHPSTFDGWMNLLKISEESLNIASFYWSLKGSDVVNDTSAWQGETIYQEILNAGTKRGIKVKIAQNMPSYSQPNKDTEELEKLGAAEVRSLDFKKLLGAGVLHTKFWMVDGKHFYIGSANMDWRSLTQVKEVGVVIYNCSCLASDLQKIFDVYWYLGRMNATVPDQWPSSLATEINKNNPMEIEANGTKTLTYLSSSPKSFNPKGRTSDIDTILSVIFKAKESVNIAVMDYYPTTLYMRYNKYWPVIDQALRKVAFEKGIKVRILVSKWNSTREIMFTFLKSMAILNSTKMNVEVKYFVVPSDERQRSIPFARVNHNKYMVTDNVAYIGTSNWSGDYFLNTAGVSIIFDRNSNNSTNEPIREELLGIFERDWSSIYAHPLMEL